MRKDRTVNIKRMVCIMANELRKTGMNLSEAFKKAWRRVKKTMTVRVVGTTFENRQERLHFLQQFKTEDLSVTLDREPDNPYDRNAIAVTVHIEPLKKKTKIGYIPKGLSHELAKVLDSKKVQIKALFMGVIGGYLDKENLGAMVNIAV